MSESLHVPYGDQIIEFQLSRRDRKTLSISVRPDLEVEVVAPHEASMEAILEKLRRRAPWIQRQLRFFD